MTVINIIKKDDKDQVLFKLGSDSNIMFISNMIKNMVEPILENSDLDEFDVPIKSEFYTEYSGRKFIEFATHFENFTFKDSEKLSKNDLFTDEDDVNKEGVFVRKYKSNESIGSDEYRTNDHLEFLKNFFKDIVSLDEKTNNLLEFANYLDCKTLLNLTCEHIASLLTDKSVEEMREFFGITDTGFTEEEEEVLRCGNNFLLNEDELKKEIEKKEDMDTT